MNPLGTHNLTTVPSILSIMAFADPHQLLKLFLKLYSCKLPVVLSIRQKLTQLLKFLFHLICFRRLFLSILS